MPQSLALSTPPTSAPSKRQRSRGPEEEAKAGAAAGQAQSAAAFAANREHEPRVPVRMPAYLNKSKSEITSVFQDLEWKQRFRLSHALNNPQDSPFRVDRSITVINRNRYGNVQPWDSSRIKLKTPIGGSDYINASPISLKSRAKKHDSGSATPDPTSTKTADVVPQSRYIATQGPKEGQYSHFWSMIMQETVGPVGVIVMLTQLTEGLKEKCAQYFPRDMDNPTIVLPAHEDGEDQLNVADGNMSGPRSETVDDGDPFTDPKPLSADTDPFPELGAASNDSTEDTDPSQLTPAEGSTLQIQPEEQSDPSSGSVDLLSVHQDPLLACEVRHMSLKIGSESKEIYHYLFTGWPDYGKPEAEDRRALLELLRVSKVKAGPAESGNPRFVHCSAGVGRTGTFIALDFLVAEIEAGRVGVSLPSTPAGSSVKLSNGNGNGNGPAAGDTAKTETWGRSGPAKQKELTPDPSPRGERGDLIYETVNTLREQRMMMVMNELQFSFIYEVLREVFVEWSANGKGPGGVSIRGAGADAAVQEPVAKAPRIEGDEDVGVLSEAETEIIADDKEMAMGQPVARTEDTSPGPTTALPAEPTADLTKEADETDPYAVVAPESIRKGTEKGQ